MNVLITGASRGFGRALFDVYAERKWTIFPLVRDPEVGSQLKKKRRKECYPIVGDVATEEVEQQIRSTLGKYAMRLDLLINNAGNIIKNRGLYNSSPQELEELFRVHCIGVFRCTKAALPFLLKAEHPVVINISSRWSSITRTVEDRGSRIYSYQIAKCAQNMLTACLDEEFRDQNIRFFAVHPGQLKTEIAPRDADIDPHVAAVALADWIQEVEKNTPCGLHSLMSEQLIAW